MKKIRVIDTVAKALDHNTAVTLITTFGSTNDVMVFNASTNALIATVRRPDNRHDQFIVNGTAVSYNGLAALLTNSPGFPRGASKSRNYSRPVLREGVVL